MDIIEQFHTSARASFTLADGPLSPLHHIERCGQITYPHTPPSCSSELIKYYRYLYTTGKWSVFEHCNFVFQTGYPLPYNCLLYTPSNCSRSYVNHTTNKVNERHLVSTNFRVLLEEPLYRGLLDCVLQTFTDMCIPDKLMPSRVTQNSHLKIVSLSAYVDLTDEEQGCHSYRTIFFTSSRTVCANLASHRRCAVCTDTPDSSVAIRKDQFKVIRPVLWNPTDVGWNIWKNGIEESERCYFAALDNNLDKQSASSLLPDSLSSTVGVTTCLSEWENIFKSGVNYNSFPQLQKLLLSALNEVQYSYTNRQSLQLIGTNSYNNM